MSLRFLVVATVLFAVAAHAVPAHAQDFVQLPPALDQRAARIDEHIMCPICHGQTISQSNSDIAGTMRQMVRERLLAGDTDAQIYAFMANAFGDDILASPPTHGAGLLAWVIPPMAVLLGAIVIVFTIRRLRRASVGEPSQEAASANGAASSGDPYLVLVDQEMEGGH